MAGKDNGETQSRFFLTEDIVINILLRLPIASCIFRFRCVCKLWRILLSDPQFIRKILYFQTPADRKSLQTLIAGGDAARARRIHYSLHSYDTLCPISAAGAVGDLPSIPYKMRSYHSHTRLTIVGCCDGIFCISDTNYGGASDIILWNPTTSETKFLPLSPCPHPPYIRMRFEHTGFGFDPLTGDYKVVRVLKFEGYGFDDPPEPGPPPFSYTEVYSLRNDSWKRRYDSSCLVDEEPGYVHQNTPRNESCYWYYTIDDENFDIVSFDMRNEVFERMTVAAPPHIYTGDWYSKSCFMLKDSFVTTFGPSEYLYDYTPIEIWGLMKYGVSESWTKLFTFESPSMNCNLEIWKDGMYIHSQERRHLLAYGARAPQVTDHGVFILDPDTGEFIGNCLEVHGRTHPFQAQTYTPTQISLSDL